MKEFTIYGEEIRKVRICKCGFPAYVGRRHPECAKQMRKDRQLTHRAEARGLRHFRKAEQTQ